MKHFKEKLIRGVKWSALNQVGSQLITLGVSIYLARLLSPETFGTLGMITVISGFAQIFISLGFDKALIQKMEVSQEELSSVFWFNLLLGGGMSILFFGVSPLISLFYSKPELTDLTRLLSIQFFIGALGMVHYTNLTRKLQFRDIAIINTISKVVAGIGAILLAYQGIGVWSIALQSVIQVTVWVLMLWGFSKWRPSFVFTWYYIKDMSSFGGYVTMETIFAYWTRNLDNLLIAKFLGGYSLGLYTRSYSLMMLPLTNISSTVSRVMFPSFSSIQNDIERVKKVYLKMIQSIALISFPLMAGLCALADLVVLTLFGEEWRGMIPLIRILSLLGAIQSILTLNGTIYNSLKRADLAFKISLLLNVNLFIGFSVGLYLGGLEGLCIGYAIVSCINFFPSFYFAARLINLTITEKLKNLSGIFLCTCAMALAVLAIKESSMFNEMAQWIELSLLVASGALIYFFMIFLFKVSIFEELKSTLLGKKTQVLGSKVISD